MSEEIRLEAFGERLKGCKIYCTGSQTLLPGLLQSRVSVLDSEVAQRGRRVLVMYDGSSVTWLQRMKWDAVFILKDSSDIRLALTYITNCSKPVRVVWFGEPSAQVKVHLSKCEGLTLIGLGLSAPVGEWDAVFWSHDVSTHVIESTLNSNMGPVTTGKYNLDSVLKEIRGSELGLVWSSIGESDKKGSLYWFDPSEGAGGSTYSIKESAELLRSIADSLSVIAK
jgi:hypothetical protein